MKEGVRRKLATYHLYWCCGGVLNPYSALEAGEQALISDSGLLGSGMIKIL